MKNKGILYSFVMLLLVVLLVSIFSCDTPQAVLSRGKKFLKEKRFENAEKEFLSVVIKWPSDKNCAEAMFELGNICKEIKKDYNQSVLWYSQVVKKFPATEFAKVAEVKILESPDYLGLIDKNRVILGDSETKGRNMRLETRVEKLDYNLYLMQSDLFAGDKFVRTEKKYYLKKNGEIREFNVNPSEIKNESKVESKIVLKYPFVSGNVWKTYFAGKSFVLKIVEDNITMNIADKKFDKCIKVMEKIEDSVGVKYFYYAADVGCIKITTASNEESKKEYTSVELVK